MIRRISRLIVIFKYTQSGSTKKYESDQLGLGSIPMYVTGYTVGYPSTAYYPDAFIGGGNFYCFAYPGPPYWPIYPGFTEGTGEYIYNVSFNGTDTYNKIYNLITDTPPDGFELDENARDYVVTKIVDVYSCNMNVEYGGVINSINGGTRTIEREFRYKKKDKPDNKINVRLSVSHEIIINGNTYIPQEDKVIHTIDLKSGDGRFMDILVGLDSNHYTGSFDILFESVYGSNVEIYLSVNRHLYKVNNLTESKRCYISKSKYSFHDDGWMYTTAGFDYTFSSNAWGDNSLFTKRDIRDDFGESIPPETRMKYVVKFTLDNGDYRQDCQLDVDVTTNK